MLLLLSALTSCASAQLKVHPTYVGIGGNRITFKPANPGPEIGGTDGTRWSTISFWHTQTGWNKLLAKKYNKISDSTFKANIQPLDSATYVLRQINTYSYNFQENEYVSPKKEYGIVAQELTRILPDMVDTVNGHLCVDYDELIPFLIKGFNEQQDIIESNRSEIEELRTTVEAQRQQIKALIRILEELTKGKVPQTEP